MKTGKRHVSEYGCIGVSAQRCVAETPLLRYPVTAWIAVAVMFVAINALAADVQVSAGFDKQQIALNEQAVLSVTVSGSASSLPEPQLPALPNFQVYNAGRAQNFSWVNGQTSASVTYSFVLTPKQEGHFDIPPVRVQYQGQTLESSPLTLEVVKGNAAAVPAPARPSPGAERASPTRGSPGLFITETVDKHSAYVGEPVTLIFRLYNRVALMRNPQYQPPDTSGFWTEDLPPQRTYHDAVKGVPYNVTEIRTALFPTAPGKATVGAAGLTVTLENLSMDPFSADFFNNFFGGGEQKTLRTDPIRVEVKPLPEPKPAGFKGAVGQFSLAANLDKGSTTVGQPLTLAVTVAGRGNIKSLPNLLLPALTNFRTFDANAATNIEKNDYQVRGSKVFKTVLIPTTSGDLTIPPISYVYFDPETRTYKTLTTRAFTVRVAAAPAGANPAPIVYSPSAPQGPGIQVLGEDIRYIKTPASLRSQADPLYRQKWVWLVNGLSFLFAAGSGLIPLYRKVFLSNPALLRFRHAREEIGKTMQKAEEAMGRANVKGAAELLSDGFQDYLAAKLLLDIQGIALKDVLATMRDQGLNAHLAEKVRNLWETLDLYRFAPAQVRAEEIKQTRQSMDYLIGQLEEAIPWKD